VKGTTFSPTVDHPGGCFACRYFGHRVCGDAVCCAKPGAEHVRSQAHLMGRGRIKGEISGRE
jgi:hypothetical protein